MLIPSILDLIQSVVTRQDDLGVTKKSDAKVTLLGDKG